MTLIQTLSLFGPQHPHLQNARLDLLSGCLPAYLQSSLPGHTRGCAPDNQSLAVGGMEKVRQSPVSPQACLLRTDTEEGQKLASRLVKAKGTNPGTEQIMERQNRSQPDITRTSMLVLPVCCALPALSHSILSPLRVQEVVQDFISTSAQESAPPDSKPDSTLPEAAQVESPGSSHMAQV